MKREKSYIKIGPGGTLFAGPDAVELMAAAVLRSGLGLMAKGIRPTRGVTMTGLLSMVTKYTGKKYKRTQHEQARADLQVWIETMKAALPVIGGDE
jgi:hypothetical protein